MKKFFINNLLLLVLLSAAQSFAAGEEDEITTLLAMARYSAPLTTEQQDVYRQQLEEWAHQRGGQSYINVSVARELQENLLQQADMPMQAGPAREFEEKEEQEVKEAKAEKKSSVSKAEEPVDKRRKKKSDSKALEYLFKHKGVPVDVVAQHMAGFLPFVPLEWNIKFPEGERVFNFSEIQGFFHPEDKLLVSSDGRYVVLMAKYGNKPEGYRSKIYVYNMQHGQKYTPEIIPNIIETPAGMFLEDVALGINGQLACLFSQGGNQTIRFMDLASNTTMREYSFGRNFPTRLDFSLDGEYLILLGKNQFEPIISIHYSHSGDIVPADKLPSQIDFVLGRFIKGSRENCFSPDYDNSMDQVAFSFDRTEKVTRERNRNSIQDTLLFDSVPNRRFAFPILKAKIDIPHLDQVEDQTAFPDQMCLSPDGLRACIVRNLKSRYEIQMYTVPNKMMVLDEISRERKDPREWVYDHFKIIGVSFSPGGGYLMLALYDHAKRAYVMKLYDLRQEAVNDGGEPAAQHEFSGNVPAALDDGGAGDYENDSDRDMPELVSASNTDDEMPELEPVPENE